MHGLSGLHAGSTASVRLCGVLFDVMWIIGHLDRTSTASGLLG
jgi:hypothetical protein